MTNSSTPEAGSSHSSLAALPLRHETDFSGADGIGPFQALTVVLLLALFAGVVVWRRRRSGSKLPRSWQQWLKPGVDPAAACLLQTTQLTPSASVHVLRWDGQEWLLGCSEQGISVLGKRQERQAPSFDSHAGEDRA